MRDQRCPISYGGQLCALTKPNGGVRPITASKTLRRVTGTFSWHVRWGNLSSSPRLQCEGVAHAARTYPPNQTYNNALLKIDVFSAFNCLRQDIFLARIREKVPSLYKLLWQANKLLWQAYFQPSKLFFGNYIIEQSEDFQEGDPISPAFFALSVDPIAKDLRSEFKVCYLDDACFAGHRNTVLKDLENMVTKLGELDLNVNSNKCEISLLEHTELDASYKVAILRKMNSLHSAIKAKVSRFFIGTCLATMFTTNQ